MSKDQAETSDNDLFPDARSLNTSISSSAASSPPESTISGLPEVLQRQLNERRQQINREIESFRQYKLREFDIFQNEVLKAFARSKQQSEATPPPRRPKPGLQLPSIPSNLKGSSNSRGANEVRLAKIAGVPFEKKKKHVMFMLDEQIPPVSPGAELILDRSNPGNREEDGLDYFSMAGSADYSEETDSGLIATGHGISAEEELLSEDEDLGRFSTRMHQLNTSSDDEGFEEDERRPETTTTDTIGKSSSIFQLGGDDGDDFDDDNNSSYEPTAETRSNLDQSQVHSHLSSSAPSSYFDFSRRMRAPSGVNTSARSSKTNPYRSDEYDVFEFDEAMNPPQRYGTNDSNFSSPVDSKNSSPSSPSRFHREYQSHNYGYMNPRTYTIQDDDLLLLNGNADYEQSSVASISSTEQHSISGQGGIGIPSSANSSHASSIENDGSTEQISNYASSLPIEIGFHASRYSGHSANHDQSGEEMGVRGGVLEDEQEVDQLKSLKNPQGMSFSKRFQWETIFKQNKK
ncbi:uncharacterized protein V1510DRAFT_405765 [Dipodascopsis tothii]|uniref:uncharacterized protein n=1 Tax=Dipodascopsis tothii TaxID=44089 RepID=UPI0034CDE7EE